MPNESKPSTGIAKLAHRAGLKGNRLAKACGWKARNGPQPYLEGRAPLTLEIAAKFAMGLVGNGVPPVRAEEILDLVEDKGVLEYFWDVGAPQPKAPHEETVRSALEAGLLSLTEPRATVADLPILAHGVSAVLQFVADDPARENSPGFPEAVVGIVHTAIRNYKPSPAPAS